MRNNGITLSAAELVYLAQLHEQGVLLGIRDPFFLMNESEKAGAIVDVEESLTERELWKRAFGGVVKVRPDLERMINHCVNYEFYIGIDKQIEKTPLETKRFFYCEDEWTLIEGTIDDFVIASADGEEVKKEVFSLPSSNGPADGEGLLLQRRNMKQLGRLFSDGDEEDAKKLIRDAEGTSFAKDFLLKILSGKATFASLSLAASTPEGSAADTASVFSIDDCAMELYEEIGDDDRTMTGLRTAASGVYSQLKEIAEEWSTQLS